MKFNFNAVMLASAVIIAIIFVMSGCESYAKYDHPDCPVCGESYASDEHLDAHCATNFEFSDNPLIATRCLGCGVHFVGPRYEEHVKTCDGVAFDPY